MPKPKKLPRGLRMNNPGNLEKYGVRPGKFKYVGEIVPSADSRFAQFESMEKGVRAMYMVLLNYILSDKLDTPWEIISQWAPAKENNVTAYVADVCRQTNFEATQPIAPTFALLGPFVRAICVHENGNVANDVLSPDVFKSAWEMVPVEGTYAKYGYGQR